MSSLTGCNESGSDSWPKHNLVHAEDLRAFQLHIEDKIMKRLVATLAVFGLVICRATAVEVETLAVVRELDEIEVPAQRDGLLAEMLVRRGHTIHKGQLIAELDKNDTSLKLAVARAELQMAQMKSENDGPVLVAKTAVSRASTEGRLLEELGDNAVYLERFRQKNSAEKSAAELRSAENQLMQDRMQVDVKVSQARVLENDLKLTSIVSPVDGLIQEQVKQHGEWVKQGETVVKITRMDHLLVEGFLDSKTVSPHALPGAKVRSTIKVSGEGAVEFEGLVVEQAAPKLEVDGKFPVWVEIPNRMVVDRTGKERWLLRPGMTGTMIVILD
jgi:multidrug resistance efflux pump